MQPCSAPLALGFSEHPCSVLWFPKTVLSLLGAQNHHRLPLCAAGLFLVLSRASVADPPPPCLGGGDLGLPRLNFFFLLLCCPMINTCPDFPYPIISLILLFYYFIIL